MATGPSRRIVDPEDAEATQQSVCPRMSLLPVRCTKTIHFVRHGQGFHNVAGHIDRANYKLWEYEDAHLTELGWRQAENLGRHVSAVRLPVDLVVVAPLQRALETAVAAFGGGPAAGALEMKDEGSPLLMVAQEGLEGRRVGRPAVRAERCPPFLAHELCREHLGVHPCDKRNDVSVYKQRFPAVDFSLIQSDQDVLWTQHHRETRDEIRRRGLSFLRWLATRPERSIAVVCHSSFLHFTLSCFGHGAPAHLQGELHKWFDNCEMRSVTMCDEEGEGAAGGPDGWQFAGGLAAGGDDVSGSGSGATAVGM